VNVSTFGMPYVISARKEVIISAGVFHSPQLLMVSGVGPTNTLRKFNIQAVSNLSGVGQNMKDSARIGAVIRPINMNSFSTQVLAQDPILQAAVSQEFLDNGTGPLTNPTGDYIGWEKIPASFRSNLSSKAQSDLAQFPSDWPEVEYLITERSALTSTGVINEGVVSFALTATLSKGNVTIKSDSIFDSPVVSPNWLLDPTDMEVAVQGYRRARQAWTFMDEVATGPELSPGTNITTDEQLVAFIRSSVAAVHHSTATCAMGQAGDPQAVVDSHGKVFGVRNLRIIDASSLPFTPPGHTQGTIYAHAEKLVNDIKMGM